MLARVAPRNPHQLIRPILSTQLQHFTSMSSYTSPFAPKAGEKLTLSSTVPLLDNTTMPRFGIGAWEMTSDTIPALRSAVESVGYVHIDTAQYYRNESSVGQYARESSVGREKLFITTKTFTKGKGAKESIERSLEKAGLEYWDLVLIHAPDGGKKARAETWEALSGLVEEGKVRRLGVSNYGEKHIKELLDSKPKVLPVVNQIECHPFFAQVPLRKYCESQGIVIQAYCPLARQQYDSDPTLQSLARSKGKSVAQIMLRWSIQSGLVPLPKSSNEGRQKENAEALTGGWELSDEEMKVLDGLDRGARGAVEVQTMSQEAP